MRHKRKQQQSVRTKYSPSPKGGEVSAEVHSLVCADGASSAVLKKAAEDVDVASVRKFLHREGSQQKQKLAQEPDPSNLMTFEGETINA